MTITEPEVLNYAAISRKASRISKALDALLFLELAAIGIAIYFDWRSREAPVGYPLSMRFERYAAAAFALAIIVVVVQLIRFAATWFRERSFFPKGRVGIVAACSVSMFVIAVIASLLILPEPPP